MRTVFHGVIVENGDDVEALCLDFTTTTETMGSKEDGSNTTDLEYGAGVFEGIQCYVDPDEDERRFLI